VVKEGEMVLLPRWVPHRPQRPAGTVGLIVEFPRPAGQQDALRWYCAECDQLVHEARWTLKKIDEDLRVIMEAFWSGPVENRTCRNCGAVVERAGAVQLKSGRVRAAKGTKKPAPRAPGKKAAGKAPARRAGKRVSRR
jgi:3-hydroxyanthranilate 3,4-dioxygenase